jgi:ketopantoate reductase
VRIAAVGSGGIGGSYGARLAKAGHDVTFIARGAYLETMRRRHRRRDSTRAVGHWPMSTTETLASAYPDRPSPRRRNDETSAVAKGKTEKS